MVHVNAIGSCATAALRQFRNRSKSGNDWRIIWTPLRWNLDDWGSIHEFCSFGAEIDVLFLRNDQSITNA